MSVAKTDIETLRCIAGGSKWELCTRIKEARSELAELKAKIDKLLEALR